MSKRARVKRNKRLRRDVRKVLKHGPKAKATHRLKGGRTGQVHSKKLKASK